jgi:hypothetical protein
MQTVNLLRAELHAVQARLGTADELTTDLKTCQDLAHQINNHLQEIQMREELQQLYKEPKFST